MKFLSTNFTIICNVFKNVLLLTDDSVGARISKTKPCMLGEF